MPDWSKKTISSSITKEIKQSQKQVTILFTDIVFSTMHWDLNGDIKGRLMVDKHNRLVMPVVQHFRGEVVKTIGDSVMAMFNRPADAIRAAIGIQQSLERMREEDENFDIHVRIGMHTGMAIVEPNDVFGDVVNVASRIENEAEGDEIFLSDTMAEMLKDQGYFINKAGIFTFKGKKDPMTVFRCDWSYCKDMTSGMAPGGRLPLSAEKRREQVVHFVLVIAGLMAAYYLYLRFILADQFPLSLKQMNPGMVLREGGQVEWALLIVGILFCILVLRRFRLFSSFKQRLLKGSFGFFLGFLLFTIPTMLLPAGPLDHLKAQIYETGVQFVTVEQEYAPVHTQPGTSFEEVGKLREGDVGLLQKELRTKRGSWYRIGVDAQDSGWVQGFVLPDKLESGKEVSSVSSFTLSRRDLFALMFGVLGFIWGFFDFRVRPA
jgi:class 3 adenylate cyclase